MFRKTTALILALAFLLGPSIFAGVKGEHKTFSGTLSCLGCDLKKAVGAHAQCSVYGHTHALKLDDGRYISVMENDNSADLIKGKKWHGKKVKVHGVYLTQANLLDVESFEVEGKSYGWCEKHKRMDQCHVKMFQE